MSYDWYYEKKERRFYEELDQIGREQEEEHKQRIAEYDRKDEEFHQEYLDRCRNQDEDMDEDDSVEKSIQKIANELNSFYKRDRK